MRTALAVIVAVFFLHTGSMLIFAAPWSWFRAALGVLLYTVVVGQLAMAKILAPIRQRLGLSVVRGLQLWCGGYVPAGIFCVAGAVISLEGAFAVIVGYAALSWIWLWVWMLTQSVKWIEPNTAPFDSAELR